MKNIAIIFAGGQGMRMHEYSRPKQFLEYRGKPIVIYTLEQFQQHRDIDGIIVACLNGWIPYLEGQIKKYHIDKVVEIVVGGATGQESIFNALECASRHFPDNSLVLIHDGVRPLINASTISENIKIAREKGSCVTCVPATETFLVRRVDGSIAVLDREQSLLARAPQTFTLKNVFKVHKMAIEDGVNNYIDTCTMMNHYGYDFATCLGSVENIKITTPSDFFIFRAIQEAREEGVVFGL